ncbi:unnamed protein product [Paramecium primaurelia]|uniref:Uncharacterized protein n=1 Tax=Paramecium primaurelia TaxID=5886 RepID=A0A8S1M4T5_PARPR|nr:unnamed protein product [Paramecium primaurelia]
MMEIKSKMMDVISVNLIVVFIVQIVSLESVKNAILVILQLMDIVFPIVEMEFQLLDWKNVMMAIQYLMMAVLIVHTNVLQIVYYVIKEYVINNVKQVLNLLINLAYLYAEMD